MTVDTDDDWAAWWRGDLLREPREPELPPDPPEMARWGVDLDFLLADYSNVAPEEVRAKLIETFRRGSDWDGDLLALLADMLDPSGKSTWRLELRRRRGAPGRLSELDQKYLRYKYERRVQELKEKRRASPAKTARGELAKEYTMTDEQIRALIDRAQGKRRRRLKSPGRK